MWSDAAVIAVATGASTLVAGISGVVMRYYFVPRAACIALHAEELNRLMEVKRIAASVDERLRQDEKDYLTREAFGREHSLICDARTSRVEKYVDDRIRQTEDRIAGTEKRILDAIREVIRNESGRERGDHKAAK